MNRIRSFTKMPPPPSRKNNADLMIFKWKRCGNGNGEFLVCTSWDKQPALMNFFCIFFKKTKITRVTGYAQNDKTLIFRFFSETCFSRFCFWKFFTKKNNNKTLIYYFVGQNILKSRICRLKSETILKFQFFVKNILLPFVCFLSNFHK